MIVNYLYGEGVIKKSNVFNVIIRQSNNEKSKRFGKRFSNQVLSRP
jgi:hypothetical protein